jgi:hypothetical protein
MNIYHRHATDKKAAAMLEVTPYGKLDTAQPHVTLTNVIETSWIRYDLLRLDRDCVRKEHDRRT